MQLDFLVGFVLGVVVCLILNYKLNKNTMNLIMECQKEMEECFKHLNSERD